MSALMLFKINVISAENFVVSHNLAENSNSQQNTANPNIGCIFDLAGFIFSNITARVCITSPSPQHCGQLRSAAADHRHGHR